MKTFIYFYSILFINTITAEEELPLGIERSDIGIDDLIKMASNQFPTPSVTPVGKTKAQLFHHSTCSNDSVIQEMAANISFPYPFMCNGKQAFIMPWYYDIKMNDGQTTRLTLPKVTYLVSNLNGNLIVTATGTVDDPPQCKGDHYMKVLFIVAKNQYQCLSTGVTGHTIVYLLNQITGKCKSICWLLSGNSSLDPPVNNLGLGNKQ